MIIVINSHKKSEKALSHLLESIQKNKKFSFFKIFIFIGGFYDIKDYEIYTKENLVYIHCNHNSIDCTGLISLYELYEKDEENIYFYMHDTCRVGDKFLDILDSFNGEISSIRINLHYSMNMGIYSQKIINKFGKQLLKYKNTIDEKCRHFKSICILNEDLIFKGDPNNYIFQNFAIEEKHISAPVDYYNTGVLRRIEYYPNFDLYKMKANYIDEKEEILELNN